MGLTIAELARRFDCKVRGDPDIEINGVAALDRAGPNDIAFFANRRYKSHLASTKAGAVILRRDDTQFYAGNALITDNPYLRFAEMMKFVISSDTSYSPGIHSTAVIGDSANVSETAHIGEYVIIEDGACIGEHVTIVSGCHIEKDVVVGDRTKIYSNVVIRYGCKIGSDCIIHPGVVIGSDGFGFAKDGAKWVKVPQLGGVVIGNDVEIGANTVVDRGALEDTIIGNGVKLDNLIQVAHNVQIGDDTVIAGCAGIAGSAKIGKRCALGGQAGIAGHLEITDDVTIAATSLVLNSIKRPGVYSSNLKVDEYDKWKKNAARFYHLDEMARRLKQLEKKVKQFINKGQET